MLILQCPQNMTTSVAGSALIYPVNEVVTYKALITSQFCILRALGVLCIYWHNVLTELYDFVTNEKKTFFGAVRNLLTFCTIRASITLKTTWKITRKWNQQNWSTKFCNFTFRRKWSWQQNLNFLKAGIHMNFSSQRFKIFLAKDFFNFFKTFLKDISQLVVCWYENVQDTKKTNSCTVITLKVENFANQTFAKRLY